MKIIGITGGIGSGKTTISNMFKKLGADVVDADEISRRVTKKDGAAYPEILDAFKEGILLEDGELNRRAIADIVFSDKNSLELLNKITHKHVFSEMKKSIEKSKADVVVLDVPLLFSSDFPFDCDLTVGVVADRNERIKRVKMRDGLAEEEIIKRIDNQVSDEFLKEKADIIIENHDEEAAFIHVTDIFNRIRNE